MGSISERLREERDRLGLTQDQVADLTEQSRKSQMRYESGDRSPNGPYFAKLAEVGVDILYVLTGSRTPPAVQQVQSFMRQNAQMFALADKAAALEQMALQFEDADGDFVPVPVHDAMLAAGAGHENGAEDLIGHLAFRRDWLKKIDLKPDNAVIAHARGDSMAPTLHDGDAVLIDRAASLVPPAVRDQNDQRPATIYALLDDGAARIKRLAFSDPGTLVLLSDNPAYPPEFRPAEMVSIIGKVVWWGHTARG